MTRKLAILLFDEVEVLDFAGPFEVFSVCGLRSSNAKPFEVFTVAEKPSIRARNHLMINPTYVLGQEPQPDMVLIPGGGGYYADGQPFGTRKEMDNPVLLNWIRSQHQTAELILSVCTGSLLLAKADLLHGLKATTHKGAVEMMRSVAPDTVLMPQERWVDNGKIVLSAGISAGIDMSFYVISRLLGKEAADETASYMQYDYWS
jgi:transcriptional regulator GlxA family with amidase domain